MRRVGILGGTFDPIHNGHLAMADCAYRQFHLDEIRFLPAGNPPHKKNRKGATDEQRLSMVRLATENDPRFLIDEQEMHRKGYSYTSETLLRLRRQEPDTAFYFLIGADSLLSLDTWRDPEVICRNCTLLVAGRNGTKEEVLKARIGEMQEKFDASVFLMDFTELPVSSGMLRSLIRRRQPVCGYLPDSVLSYIEEKGIYRSETQ